MVSGGSREVLLVLGMGEPLQIIVGGRTSPGALASLSCHPALLIAQNLHQGAGTAQPQALS